MTIAYNTITKVSTLLWMAEGYNVMRILAIALKNSIATVVLKIFKLKFKVSTFE